MNWLSFNLHNNIRRNDNLYATRAVPVYFNTEREIIKYSNKLCADTWMRKWRSDGLNKIIDDTNRD